MATARTSHYLGLMSKLQLALKQYGVYVAIETTQFFVAERNTFIKVYHIRDASKAPKSKDAEIFKSSSCVDCVKFLANLLKIARNEITEDDIIKKESEK